MARVLGKWDHKHRADARGGRSVGDSRPAFFIHRDTMVAGGFGVARSEGISRASDLQSEKELWPEVERRSSYCERSPLTDAITEVRALRIDAIPSTMWAVRS
jgi:hypothetical protein